MIDFDKEEKELHAILQFHREQYERAIAPILKRWERLQALKPKTFVISQEQFDLIMKVRNK